MKPDKVILFSKAGERLQVKFIDFGLSQISGSTELTDPGQVMALPHTSLQRFRKVNRLTSAATFGPLGVILCQMLSGHPPFDAENRERLCYMISRTAECPDLPEKAAQISAKALVEDRAARYQSVGALWKISFSFGKRPDARAGKAEARKLR